MRANKLYVPESSLRLLLLQESHGGGLMRHFAQDKTYVTLPTSTFGQWCFAMLDAPSTDAIHAAKLSSKLNPMVFT